MFFPEGQVRVFLYGEPVSMRLSFDGLYALARHRMQVTGNPTALYFSTHGFGTMRSRSTTRGVAWSNEHWRPTGHSRSQHGESGSCATREVSRRLKHSVLVKRCRWHRSMDGEHVFATAGAMSYRRRALCRCQRHRHSSILGR